MKRKEIEPMNADEIVRELGHRADAANKRGYSGEASEWIELADLIESLQAQLATEKRRERAAVEDMKVMALAMRESEELSEGCCFACAYDGQNLPDDAILIYGECPGYEADDCFEWRGPQEVWKGE